MKISVVICTYNRVKYLPKCLEHLKNQEFEKSDYEIVIIDNNSSDNTHEVSNNFIETNPNLNITYFLETKPGLSHARNAGIEKSNGEIITFIDDDGFACKNFLKNLYSVTSSSQYSKYKAFGGKVIPVYNPTKEPKWLSKYIEGVVSKVDLGNQIIPFNRKYPAGCNMSFRRNVFEQYGGFNPDLHTRGDDKFVFDKLKKHDVPILYIPNIEVEHFIDDYRIEKSFIIKLSKIIGQSEAIRLRSNPLQLLLKLIEYLFKLGIAIAIAISFVLKGEISKANYILLVRYYVLIGFFIQKKL